MQEFTILSALLTTAAVLLLVLLVRRQKHGDAMARAYAAQALVAMEEAHRLMWSLGRRGSITPEPLAEVENLKASTSQDELLTLARELFCPRPLAPYPRWYFDADWENPDFVYQLRRGIWERFLGDGGDHELIVDWHRGLRLSLHLGNDLSKQIFVGGCNEPNEMLLLSQLLEEGMTFVDAGANEGIYTLLGASLVGETGKVYSFEPSPRERRRLERNLQLNRLEQVKVSCAALADCNGRAELSMANDEHSGHNTLGGMVHAGSIEVSRQEVDLRRLDTVAEEEGLTRLDVMKADVEGAELRLLRGAEATLKRFRPVLLLEVVDKALRRQGGSADELIQWLTDRDYRPYRFGGGGLPEPAEPFWGESLVAAPAEKTLPAGMSWAKRIIARR